jgi:hypothetical protein
MEHRLGLGLHQIEHCFGLSQVQPAMKKGPSSELARFSQTRTLSQTEALDLLQWDKPTVTVDLHHILAGVGAWRGHVDR